MTREQIKKSQISARIPRKVMANHKPNFMFRSNQIPDPNLNTWPNKVVMVNGKPQNQEADTPMTRGEIAQEQKRWQDMDWLAKQGVNSIARVKPAVVARTERWQKIFDYIDQVQV